MNTKHENLAILMVTCAFLLGSIQAAMVKEAAQQVPFVMVVFILYFVCLLYYVPLLIRTKLGALKSERKPLLIIRALAGLALWFGIYYSLKYIPLVDSTLLINLSPAWVPIIAYFGFKKSIKKRLYLGIIIAFLGAAFILKPDRHVFELAALAALAGGFFMAITMVAVKELMRTEKSSTIVIYYFMVNAICLLPFAIKYWTIPNFFVLLLLVGNAILMIIHMALLNYGFKMGHASKLSVLTYAGVLFAAFLGWIFFKEIPDIWAIYGGILICLGGLYVLRLRMRY